MLSYVSKRVFGGHLKKLMTLPLMTFLLLSFGFCSFFGQALAGRGECHREQELDSPLFVVTQM